MRTFVRWALPFLCVLALFAFLVFYKTSTATQGNFFSGTFGGVSLNIELATTSQAQLKGLGSRTSIPEAYGMLFVFPKDDYYGFWMKDTLIPLDMFWLDAKGQVVSIKQNALPKSYPTAFYPSVPARYVLETRAGFALLHGIATGTPLLLQSWSTVSK